MMSVNQVPLASVAQLAEVQSRVLSLADLSPDEAGQRLESIRADLPPVNRLDFTAPLPELDSGGADSFFLQHATLVEVYRALFEVGDAVFSAYRAQIAQDGHPLYDLLRDMVVSQNLVLRLATAVKSAAKQFTDLEAKIAADPSAPAGKAARRRHALAKIAKHRIALATLTVHAINFRVPSVSDVGHVIDVVAQLPSGDAVSVPLVTAALSAVRVAARPTEPPRSMRADSANTAAAAAAAAAAASGARTHELQAPELQQLAAKIAELNFVQPALRAVLLSAIAVSQSAPAAAPATNRLAALGAVKSAQEPIKKHLPDALVWLITHVAANLPRPHDPLSPGVDALYRSVPKSANPVVRYVLPEDALHQARRELEFLIGNMLVRCSEALAALHHADEVALQKADAAAAASLKPTPGSGAPSAATTSPSAAAAATTSGSTMKPELTRCNFELLCLLVTLVLEGSPSESRSFWQGDSALVRFLQSAAQSQHRRLQTTAYHMIAALTQGPAAAGTAFELVNASQLGSVTWIQVLEGLKYYVGAYKNLAAQATAGHMSQAEVDFLVSLLRVFRQVVRYDGRARREILTTSNMGGNDALQLLFVLLTCKVPLRLKAALADTIAALAAPGSSLPREDEQHIAQRVWSYIESIGMIPQVGQVHGIARTGIAQDLEEREIPLRAFPLTGAFVRILRNLTPSSDHSAFTSSPSTASAPSLSMGATAPSTSFLSLSFANSSMSSRGGDGLWPYYHYMAHDVFQRLSELEFADERERWSLLSACMEVFLQCLSDLDVTTQSLLRASGDLAMGGASLQIAQHQISVHPGTRFLLDIFQGGKLLDAILMVISLGYNALERDAMFADELLTLKVAPSSFVAPPVQLPPGGSTAAAAAAAAQNMAATAAAAAAAAKFPDASRSGEFHTAIHSCFKLLHQILVMQSRFLHEIVPKFVLAPRSTSTLRELDKLLATRSRSVVDLVSFVSPEYDAFGDLGILSVKILASLSLAPTYGPSQGASPLVSILSANSSANTILKAYLDKFRDYDMAPLPFTLGAYDELMVHSPRLAILQLIVSNLRRPQVPSLGHFILGLVKSGALVADERSMADGTLLSLVVKLASAPGGQAPDLPLGLVELAYEAMYHLASHPATSALFSVLEQGYFASLATYWLSASRLPSVDGIPVAKDQFIELLPADSDMAQPNLRASMMLSTPSKRMFAAAPGQQQRTSSGQRTTAFSSAATGAGRRTASGAATAGSQGKIVSEIVSTLSAWTWLLRLMAVQLKAFADQPAFLTDLIKQLYLSPGGGDCRMVQVIHAAMRVCVPSAPETHPQAAALFQSVMSDDVGGAGTWPTLTDSQGLVLFDITKARTVAESIAPRSIQDQFASTKPLPATPGPSSFATGGNQTVSGHAAVVEGLLVLLAHENRKRRVLHAQTQLVQAWTETVSVTALACIGQLGGPTDSQSDRSSTLVALLVTVQELIRASPPASRVYFVKCLPLLLAILDQAVGMDSGSDHSVLDRTLATMVSACKDSDSTPFIRGNLYVGLLIVLEMTGISTGSSPLDPAASILNRSIVPGWTNASSIMANRSMFMRSTLGGASVMGKSSGGTMLANSSQDTLLRTLRTLGGESFLQALCKDAAQPSIWQSVALTALDVLCQWSLHSSTMRPWILESLQATGDVQSLAGVLIHMLPRLAGICSAASDDSLSADDSVTLLTYQSLLALLLRLSMHRQTRSMLIEAGVIGALADAACFSYIAGDGGRSSRGGGFGASVGRRTQTSQRSMMMDIDVNPALSRAVDPYAYFEGQLAAEQVPEAFERYNRVLSSALELLGFITTVHAVQSRPASSSSSPTAESGGSSDANPVLVKSCERFLAAHAASLTRVVTACTSVLRERVPTDDAKDDAELSLLTQVAQIASLADFLARSRAHVAPTVVQALFALLVVASRRDFGPARRGHLALRAERLVLQISGSIVALSLTLATTPGSTAAAVRYLFDADLAAAKDTHYVTLNRLTLGVLVLSMQQHLSRLQHASMVAEEVDHRATSGTAATSDDWRAYVQGSAGDVAQEIGFEHVSPAKRDAALRARLTALRGELATERAMLVRNLEVAMTVLRLHVLHYERQASSAVDGVAAASMGRGPQGSSAAASLGRLSTISAMKMDARTLFPMLKAQIKAAVQQSDAKAFLVAICDMIFASFGIPQDD